MTASTQIRLAGTTTDVDTAADLIARSFDHLDANHFLVPDQRRRLPIMRAFFRLDIARAVAGAGQVLIAGHNDAVAVWLDHTREQAEPDNYARQLAELTGEYLPRFEKLGRLFRTHHPQHDHWYLQYLAVDPKLWGHGIGGGLLNHTLVRLAQQKRAAYLEATNTRNRKLYTSCGFHDLTPSPITLSHGTDEVHFFPMWWQAPTR
jgi:ribosomal protein S18 acetylase RimI-like enzyme